MSRSHESDENLEKQAGSVSYSVEMMRCTLARLRAMQGSQQPEPRVTIEPYTHNEVMTATTASPSRFQSMLHRKTGPQDEAFDQTCWNSLLESFLMHARRLIEFFEDEPGNDDAVAKQFVPDSDLWAAVRKAQLTKLSPRKKDLNKHLAHFTYTATDQGKLIWELTEISTEIEDTFRGFVEKLESKRKGWFIAPRVA